GGSPLLYAVRQNHQADKTKNPHRQVDGGDHPPALDGRIDDGGQQQDERQNPADKDRRALEAVGIQQIDDQHQHAQSLQNQIRSVVKQFFHRENLLSVACAAGKGAAFYQYSTQL